jgi:hypothetical protein
MERDIPPLPPPAHATILDGFRYDCDKCNYKAKGANKQGS